MLCLCVPVRAAREPEAIGTEPATALSAADEDLLRLFEKGTRQYESDKLEEARETFEQILAMKPSSQVALAMRRKAEIGLFVNMQTQAEDAELAAAAKTLLEMMTVAAVHEKREMGNVEELLVDYQSPDVKRHLAARAELLRHGPYAVPYLLQFLSAQGPQNQIIVGRTIAALAEMPRDACLPLIAALATDDALLQSRVAGTLSQIGDIRAVPALMAIAEDTAASAPVVEAAKAAVRSITGQDAGQLPSALDLHKAVIDKYLTENGAAVGHVFGEWLPIWSWNEAAEQTASKLSYELVPGYLYYQRAGAELALLGLQSVPEDAGLKSLLLTLLCRQYKLANMAAEGGAGEAMRQDAAVRRADLEKRVATVGHLYDSDVAGQALKRALQLADGDASLVLVKLLGQKAGAESGEGAEALLAALDALDKDVRYQASIEIARRSPSGRMGEARKVMQVMAAALRYAAGRNALIVFNDLQSRNKLSAALQEHDFMTSECSAGEGAIDQCLNLRPGVDIVFLTGNLTEDAFDSIMGKLKSDARTKPVPLYVVVDAAKESPGDLSRFEGISGVLSPLEIRDAKLQPLLQEAAGHRLGPDAASRADVVLLAAQTLEGVDPVATAYPLAILEPSLLSALTGYGEPVQMATVNNLRRFGSEKALEPLGELVVATGSSVELRTAACHAIAAVARRTGQTLEPKTIDALRDAFNSDVELLKNAAAEAIGVAGIPAADLRAAVETYATPTPVAAEAAMWVPVAPPRAAGEPRFADLAPANTMAAVVIDFRRLNEAGLLDKSEALRSMADSDALPVSPDKLEKVALFLIPDAEDFDEEPAVVAVVSHRASSEEVEGMLQDGADEVAAVAGLTAYKKNDPAGLAVVADDGTLLFGTTPEALEAIIQAHRAGKGAPPAGLSRALRSYANRPVSLGLVLPEAASAAMEESLPPDMAYLKDVKRVAVGIDIVGEALSLDGIATFAKTENARLAATQANEALKSTLDGLQAMMDAGGEQPQAAMMKGVADVLGSIKVSAEGTDLRATVNVEIKDLEQLAGGMMGMMMLTGTEEAAEDDWEGAGDDWEGVGDDW